MAPEGLGRCGAAEGRVPACVCTVDASGDPRRRLGALAVAAADAEVVAAVMRVLARLPRARVLERDRRRVRARTVSPALRIPTEVTAVVGDGALHLRLTGPRGLLDPVALRTRGLALLAAVDADLRGWPPPGPPRSRR